MMVMIGMIINNECIIVFQIMITVVEGIRD